MSKERLEEFKEKIDFLDDSADMDDFGRFVDTLQNMYEDGEFHWIVRYTKEQAERVKELEEDCEYLSHHYGLEAEKNKRYREAMEKAIDELNHGCKYHAHYVLEQRLEESE